MMLNVIYVLSHKKTLFHTKFLDDTFFTQFVLSHASDNTTSQNIGGTDAWAVPHLKFRAHPPVPLGIRPFRCSVY